MRGCARVGGVQAREHLLVALLSRACLLHARLLQPALLLNCRLRCRRALHQLLVLGPGAQMPSQVLLIFGLVQYSYDLPVQHCRPPAHSPSCTETGLNTASVSTIPTLEQRHAKVAYLPMRTQNPVRSMTSIVVL